jgi:hypothetical protein
VTFFGVSINALWKDRKKLLFNRGTPIFHKIGRNNFQGAEMSCYAYLELSKRPARRAKTYKGA